MIEDIVGGALKVVGRLLGHFLIEIIFEILLKGPGCLISKQFTKRELDPDGFIVVITGLLFWGVVGFASYGIYTSIGGSASA